MTGEVLDTENNKLTISTNHFTLYGALAATTPSTTVASSSSSSSSGGDDNGSSVSVVKLGLAKIGASPFQSTRSSYVHTGGDIKISGTASQDSKIKITFDGKKKKAFYAGPGSKWAYIIFSPKQGKSYKFTIYAENEEAEVKSKTYSFSVKVAGAKTVKKSINTSAIPRKTNKTKLTSATSNNFKDCGQKHTITGGDNLWLISAKQLGRGSLYSVIINFNSDISADSILSIGQVLNIPCHK